MVEHGIEQECVEGTCHCLEMIELDRQSRELLLDQRDPFDGLTADQIYFEYGV